MHAWKSFNAGFRSQFHPEKSVVSMSWAPKIELAPYLSNRDPLPLGWMGKKGNHADTDHYDRSLIITIHTRYACAREIAIDSQITARETRREKIKLMSFLNVPLRAGSSGKNGTQIHIFTHIETAGHNQDGAKPFAPRLALLLNVLLAII